MVRFFACNLSINYFTQNVLDGVFRIYNNFSDIIIKKFLHSFFLIFLPPSIPLIIIFLSIDFLLLLAYLTLHFLCFHHIFLIVPSLFPSIPHHHLTQNCILVYLKALSLVLFSLHFILLLSVTYLPTHQSNTTFMLMTPNYTSLFPALIQHLVFLYCPLLLTLFMHGCMTIVSLSTHRKLNIC